MNIREIEWKKSYYGKLIGLIILVVICLLAWGITSNNKFVDTPNEVGYIAGFFGGLWDGICIPVNVLWSGLSIDESVYNPFNTGFAYPFAFLLPVGVFLYILVARWILHCNDL